MRIPRHLGSGVGLLAAIALAAAGCPPASTPGESGATLTAALPPYPTPAALLIVPPVSPELDPLLPGDEPAVREAQRRLIVETVRAELPPALAAGLASHGVRAEVVSADGLAGHVLAPGGDLGYASLARAHDVGHVLRIRFTGEIRVEGGTAEYGDGWLEMTYPSDTTWYELSLHAELVEVRSARVVRTIDVDDESHTGLLDLLRGVEVRDELAAQARRAGGRLADVLGAERP